MSKRLLALFSLLVIASMLLAACQQQPAATEAPPVATEEPAITEEPPAAFECTDSIGCVDIAPGDPVHIAYALVVTGPNESLGVDSRNGVEIAIDDVGGEILGHPIQFDGQDEGCGAETGQAAGTALAADPTIVAVIGTSCSSAARVSLPLMADAGFTIVSPSNTAPDLTAPGSENNYVPAYARTAHNDNLQGTVAAEFLFNELGYTKLATVHDGSIYADQLRQVVERRFTELGGTVVAQEAVSPGQTDMSANLSAIAAAEPEVIYFPIFMPEGAFIIRQAKQTPGLENVRLIGADGLFSPEVIEGAAEDVEGFLISSPALAGDAYTEFLGKYEAKFGSGPISIFHAHAYDAFMIVKNAIEKVAVQDADGTLHIPRQALREAVASTTNYEGLIGKLTCNEHLELSGTVVKEPGDCGAAGVGVWEYHFGDYEIFTNPEVFWAPGD
ncbi:MAG TPA: branched-chain amino acid ABC transporter substrate-binding protein [Anaerolineales bacterium]|nr:branched-chain amino acid ABC transporter substrate-binding protein [Anaerolineales bacterium]